MCKTLSTITFFHTLLPLQDLAPPITVMQRLDVPFESFLDASFKI